MPELRLNCAFLPAVPSRQHQDVRGYHESRRYDGKRTLGRRQASVASLHGISASAAGCGSARARFISKCHFQIS